MIVNIVVVHKWLLVRIVRCIHLRIARLWLSITWLLEAWLWLSVTWLLEAWLWLVSWLHVSSRLLVTWLHELCFRIDSSTSDDWLKFLS